MYTAGNWKNHGLAISVRGRGVIARVPLPKDGGVTECVANCHLISAAPAMYEALKALLHHHERSVCTHEETHRGGGIWTICDSCQRKWADDEGGFKPYVDPPEVENARATLALADGGK